MKIGIFGLGYVGCVSAACLAKEGHSVIGVDTNPLKVDIINSGKSPIIEKDVDRIIQEAVSSGKLRATTDASEAVLAADVSLICVGTPSNPNGSLKLDFIYNVAAQIGEILRHKDSYHSVVIRSTVLPGTVNEVARILEKKSDKKLNLDFGVASNPEFLREGSAVADFYGPPFTVVGASDERTSCVLRELYSMLQAPFIDTDIKIAEMVKYANNAFHALKVTFANEIGNLCKALGIDSHKLMAIFCLDTNLNLSPYYLRPGFAFGGSCLPKDIRAITHKSKEEDLQTPVLNSILISNNYQIERLVDRLLYLSRKKIGVLGLSFKEGTDDLRESPMVRVIETMLGKGYDIKIYDKNVSLARLFGANKEFIEKQIPHISSLICDSIDQLLDHSEVIVIANKSLEATAVLEGLNNHQHVIDLVRVVDDPSVFNSGEYEGICW